MLGIMEYLPTNTHNALAPPQLDEREQTRARAWLHPALAGVRSGWEWASCLAPWDVRAARAYGHIARVLLRRLLHARRWRLRQRLAHAQDDDDSAKFLCDAVHGLG